MSAAYVCEPHETIARGVTAALRARRAEPVEMLQRIDSAHFLHDEASLLNCDELADARAALEEDGIFEASEWEQTDLRAATKYGWAIVHGIQSAGPQPALWSVAGGEVATTPDELRFILAELKRRSAPFKNLDLCWPVALEPAIDFGEASAAFLASLADYAPAIRGSGFRLFIPNAAGKAAVLPEVRAQLGSDALLDFTNLGWLEAARLLADADATLFRALLICAQQRFVFDKTPALLSTTEDDIRTLPDVPDEELARTFLDDFRGRQLLHVAARGAFADDALRGPLAAFVASAEAQLGAAIAAELERHLA